MKFPTKTDIETLEKTSTGKGACAHAAAMIFCMDKPIICCPNAMTEQDDPTAHAVIVATRLKRREIRRAAKEYCSVFLSEKPCPMCISAIEQLNIYHLFFLENNKIKYMDLRNDNINRYEEIPVVTNK
jgi:tRNA(Arg) A34 adenosine deaminase TadA